jgi:isopentenyldiphosphate isomerase
MIEELVTLVDEKENPLGPIQISLANSNPQYLHLEVAVIIVDDKRRVLLQKRSATKKVAPSVWTVAAAGHVTWGDSADATANKELVEEIKLVVSNLVYMFSEKVDLKNESHIVRWYIGKYKSGEIVIQPREVDDFLWITSDNIDEFAKTNNVSKRTIAISKRYWAGEWDHLLK